MNDESSTKNRGSWLNVQLKKDEASIRLLNLQHGSGDQPITCDLRVASLNDNPSYETLSYVWGDLEKTVPITVDGMRFEVTQNLKDFLQCLRQPEKDRVLWADAICIDQNNMAEKNHQLGLMSQIYRQGKLANIWFGPFTSSWQNEMEFEDFLPTSKIGQDMWERVDREYERYLAEYQKAGGQPLLRSKVPKPDIQTREMIMTEAMSVLDQFADGKHLHEFPLYCIDDWNDSRMLNRFWPIICDCIRWLMSRPWWSRVWTLQEAVLPQTDPQVYVGTHKISLSRIVDGFHAFMEHAMDCCRKLHNVGWAHYQSFPTKMWEPGYRMPSYRKAHEMGELSLSELVNATKFRKATDEKDHVFGILGLLPPSYTEHFQSSYGYNLTAAEIFSQCTKLLYGSNDGSLEDLASAIGTRPTTIPHLPSWAHDLCVRFLEIDKTEKSESEDHWRCYSASRGSKYVGVTQWSHVTGSTLAVKGLFLGTVGVCGRRTTPEQWSRPLDRRHILRMVTDYHDIYKRHAKPYDRHAFWRTIFMDRDIWRYWRHDRKPLPLQRLIDIVNWWDNFKKKGDILDFTIDRSAAERTRGDYHWRALVKNLEEGRFFCTVKGEPGFGPHGIKESDLIYMVAGCPALVILRRVIKNETSCLVYVGCCFVDGYMYGSTVRGVVNWVSLDLH